VISKPLPTIHESMVESFQCPVCMHGPSPSECERYKIDSVETGEGHCSGHVVGTLIIPIGLVVIGLPKGFCRTGFSHASDRSPISKPRILLYEDPKFHPGFNHLNVPVWAIEKDGFLIVRVFSPRINETFIAIIKGGTIAAMCPNAHDVSKFIDDID
jgi:hypothetical protein